MSIEVVKYAFIAGEISPTLYGRTDLTKYDLALAEAQNYFVDYRGGLSTRPGFEFSDFVKDDDKVTRMFGFNFSPDIANSYAVQFGDGYIRFIQDNAYVLSDPLVIAGVTQANPAVVTSTAHGLSNGQWVKINGVVGMTELNGKTFEVANKTTNTFELKSVPAIVNVNSSGYTAYSSGGTASPVYELVSPYADTDLAGLTVRQYRDLLRITSADFPIYNLTRTDHADWDLAVEDLSSYPTTVDITGSSASASGSAQTVFAVSKVTDDGIESAIGAVSRLSGIINYPAEAGSVSITWAADADAKYYNVYRSIVGYSQTLYEGVELGYAGRAFGTSFTDPNIIPDFTKTPMLHRNPFAPGRISKINISAPGSGYTNFGTTISITDPDGSGFAGQVVTDASGAIVNVIIKNGGEGYTSPSVSFSGGGSGATATATAEPLTGTYPALSEIFQQRQIYGATTNQPITIWGSRIKYFSEFSSSEYALANDPFELDLDTPAVAPIRHFLTIRGGLLAFTQNDIWLLNGGSSSEPLTASNALSEPQSYTGISKLPPLKVDNDILFTEGKGYAVRALTYNELSKVYGSEDKSLLSNHLFGSGKTIVAWGFQESPYKLVWAIREDGALLAFTYIRAEEVFAWTPCSTKGRFTDLLILREGTEDRVYVTVERYINNRWTKFNERMDLRQFINVEDAFCVDAGLRLSGTTTTGTLTIYSNTVDTEWTATRSSGDFTGTEGYFIRSGNGIFEILEVLSTTSVRLNLFEAPTNFIPEDDDSQTFPVPAGDWTLDEPTTTLSGLEHLEGEEVAILGDGNVFPRQTVVDGAVTLPQPVTRAIVGLPFTCRAKTLPIIIPKADIESRRKRLVGIGIRMDKSRGIKVGPSLDRIYPLRERTTEGYGHPTRFVNGFKYQLLATQWDTNGQTYFVQEDPLPANILSIVTDMEVGDEPD